MGTEVSSIIEAQKMQGYIVAKSNQFILHSRYDLNLTEQRILACMISMLDSRPEILTANKDDESSFCALNIDTFCELCKIEKRGSVKYLKTVSQALRNKSFWMETSEGVSETFAWVDKVRVDENKGIIYLQFSNDIKPYLFNLDTDFTSYKLPMILRFNSRYSNVIFDLIYAEFGRKYRTAGVLEISVEEMKSRVQIKVNKKTNKLVNLNISFKDLRTKIIEPSIEEINKYTDIMVNVGYTKNGKKFETIQFEFKPKTKKELMAVPPFSENRIENL